MRDDTIGFIDEGTQAVWSLLEVAGGDSRRATHGAMVRFLDEPRGASRSERADEESRAGRPPKGICG